MRQYKRTSIEPWSIISGIARNKTLYVHWIPFNKDYKSYTFLCLVISINKKNTVFGIL